MPKQKVAVVDGQPLNRKVNRVFGRIMNYRYGKHIMIALAFAIVGVIGFAWASAATQTYTAWSNNDIPKNIADSDPNSVELGAKFSVTVAGKVTGVRFYKSAQNTGTHTGTLWDIRGIKLATVTFTNETASGWQTAYFSQPVNIAANWPYVISYHAPHGHYSGDNGGLVNGKTNGPLKIGKNSYGAPNGVYAYSTSTTYPSNFYQATNYWVDVVFQAPLIGQVAAPAPPTSVTAVQNGSTDVVSWNTGTSGSGINGYKVYRNGSLLVTTTGAGTSYIDKAVTSGTTYSYQVATVDSNNTASALSIKATVTYNATTPPPPGTNGCPSGQGGTPPNCVTLQDIDGGQHYFEQWANSFPSAAQNPNFFPIAVFNGFDLADKAAGHKAAGINSYAGLYNGAEAGNPSDISVAKNLGMYAISGAGNANNSTFKNAWGKTAAGWVFQDEAEGAGCNRIQVSWIAAACQESGGKILTDSYVSMANLVRKADPTRPVYSGFTNGFACNWYLNGSVANLAAGSDIIGYDTYSKINTAYGDYGGCFAPGHDWGHYLATMSARKNAGFVKPIWADLETTSMDQGLNPTGIRPSQGDLKVIAWQNIIAGARGIAWFNNNFDQRYGEATQDAINNLPNVRAAVTAVDAQITALAPVINSPFALNYETHNGQVNSMVKYYNGQFYIFVASKQAAGQNVMFTLKGAPSGSVTDVNENRTITLTNGSFSDNFSGETAYHIYKVN